MRNHMRSYATFPTGLSDTSVDLELQNLSEDEDEPTSRTRTPLRKDSRCLE